MGPGEMQRENKSDRNVKSCDAPCCDGCQCFGRAVCFKTCKARNFDTDAKTCHFIGVKHVFSAAGVNTGTRFVGLAPQCVKVRQREEQCKVECSATASYVFPYQHFQVNDQHCDHSPLLLIRYDHLRIAFGLC